MTLGQSEHREKSKMATLLMSVTPRPEMSREVTFQVYFYFPKCFYKQDVYLLLGGGCPG